MRPSPAETSPEVGDQDDSEINIRPPEPFCDAEVLDQPEAVKGTEGSGVASPPQPSGKSLVECLRLAAREVEKGKEPEPERNAAERTEHEEAMEDDKRDEPKPERSETVRTSREEKTMEESATRDSRTPETAESRGAAGPSSEQQVPALKGLEDFGKLASEECLGEAGVQNKDGGPVRDAGLGFSGLGEAADGELEFETGQEDVGTVWLAELYMDDR